MPVLHYVLQYDMLTTQFPYSYTGDIKPVVLAEAINNGPKSAQFRQMIAWITNEIRVLGNVDEQVRLKEISQIFCS